MKLSKPTMLSEKADHKLGFYRDMIIIENYSGGKMQVVRVQGDEISEGGWEPCPQGYLRDSWKYVTSSRLLCRKDANPPTQVMSQPAACSSVTCHTSGGEGLPGGCCTGYSGLL